MIILDTDVTRGMGLDSAEARLVRVIRESKTDRVAMSWMAFEERLAQYVLDYEEAHAKTLSAHRELARKLPGPEHSSTPTLTDPSLARSLWEHKLRELVDVVPTPPEAFQEALRREANCLPPAKTAGKKGGARDVAIWLTAVDYARAHPNETVYFVSRNTGDFTDGQVDYPAPMDEDRQRAGNNFVHLTALSDVLERLASPVHVTKQQVEERLLLHRNYVQAKALFTWGGAAFGVSYPVPAVWWSTGLTETVRFTTQRRVPFVTKLLDVDDIKAYQLGGSTWCTAQMTWQLIGAAIKGEGEDLACCTWTSHVLLSLADDGPAPQIFDARRPEAPTDGNTIDWEMGHRRFRKLREDKEVACRFHAPRQPSLGTVRPEELLRRASTLWATAEASSAERAMWESLDEHDRQGLMDQALDQATEGYENWPGLSGEED